MSYGDHGQRNKPSGFGRAVSGFGNCEMVSIGNKWFQEVIIVLQPNNMLNLTWDFADSPCHIKSNP